MSGDDYISKLFLDNEHKLDEMPPNNLWGRIESKLDANLPGESTETSSLKVSRQESSTTRAVGILRIVPYMAAAAVLLLLISLPFLLKNGNTPEPIFAQDLPPVEDVALEEGEPLLDSAGRIKAFQDEEDAQEKKIEKYATAVAKQTPTSEKQKLEVVLAESENSVIELTPEPKVAETKAFMEVTTTSANYNKMVETVEVDAYTNAGRNYATPPAADLSKRDEIQQIANTYNANNANNAKDEKLAEGRSAEDDKAPLLRSKSAAAKGNVPNKKTDDFLVPQLQIFDWMLGEWTDSDMEGGESHEVWKRITPTTIECNGYRLKRKGKEKIFEEKITIYFDPALKQVFMKMPIDDSRQEVVYILTKFDNEYITFEQKEEKSHPDEVVFQRSIKGFKVIINHNGNFLETNQQAYFANRNRVTNVRAIRVMEPTKKK